MWYLDIQPHMRIQWRFMKQCGRFNFLSCAGRNPLLGASYITSINVPRSLVVESTKKGFYLWDLYTALLSRRFSLTPLKA